eukprot:4490391-Amphidinium_carterae.1
MLSDVIVLLDLFGVLENMCADGKQGLIGSAATSRSRRSKLCMLLGGAVCALDAPVVLVMQGSFLLKLRSFSALNEEAISLVRAGDVSDNYDVSRHCQLL